MSSIMSSPAVARRISIVSSRSSLYNVLKLEAEMLLGPYLRDKYVHTVIEDSHGSLQTPQSSLGYAARGNASQQMDENYIYFVDLDDSLLEKMIWIAEKDVQMTTTTAELEQKTVELDQYFRVLDLKTKYGLTQAAWEFQIMSLFELGRKHIMAEGETPPYDWLDLRSELLKDDVNLQGESPEDFPKSPNYVARRLRSEKLLSSRVDREKTHKIVRKSIGLSN